jgi:hypothetical protein
MGSHLIIKVLLLLRLVLQLAPPAVVETSLSHLILSHLASHFFDPQVTQTPDGADVPDLHVAHRPKLIPTGAKQRRHISPAGDGFGSIAAVPEGVAIPRRRTDTVSIAVHPATGFPLHRRRLAQRSAPGPGMETPPQGNDGGAIFA